MLTGEIMLNTRYICNQHPEIYIFQSTFITALRDNTKIILDLPGEGLNSVKRCKQEAKKWLGEWTKKLSWREEKICPNCGSALRYYPTDYNDYVCDSCGKSFTIFGEQGRKHNKKMVQTSPARNGLS